MELSNRIVKIRKTYGFSQADLAFKLDISPQAYGKVERNASKASYETLNKVANAIGINVTFLIDLDNPTFRK